MFLKALIKNNIISKEEEIFYQHGLDMLISNVLLLGTIFTIGCITRMLIETIMFIVIFIRLRHFIGGYHAKTRLKCYCISNLVYLAVLSLTKMSAILEYKFIVIGCAILSIYSVAIIWKIAPIISTNSIKTSNEIEEDKISARIFVIGILIVAISGMMLFKEVCQFSCVIILTVMAVTILLEISYRIKEKENEK